MKKQFKLGTFTFEINYPEELSIPADFLIFEQESQSVDYIYTIELTNEIVIPKMEPISARSDMLIYQNKEFENRLIGSRGELENNFYAYYEEVDEHSASILVCVDKWQGLYLNSAFTSLFAFERRMLAYHSLVLHSAYIQHQNYAILFSAPSGTGKSTQANLWETYQNAQTINGDRCLIINEYNHWTANGWPVSGTSGICKNVTTPIQAIVMLAQSPYNHIRKLSHMEAVQLLYAQVTVNYWNVQAVQETLDLLETLVADIPVFQLFCNISEDAVNCLKIELEQIDSLA